MNQEHHFPNDLKRLRKSAGLRQIDVAQMLGHVSADRVSHWEKGLAVPGLVNLLKLAIIYGTSPERLYGELHTSMVEKLKSIRSTDHNMAGEPSQPKAPTDTSRRL